MQTHLGPDPFIVGDEATVISQGPPRLLPQFRPGTHPTELGRLLEGERLGHFELEEFIGGGGMGAVFRALDTMLNRIVAVKVLSSDQAGDEDTQRRFKNEAQSAARLDHENIARVYYVGEDRGVHYIVFEYIEGINIRDLVTRDGPLPLIDAISYTWQIAQALNHASQRDVVHRDIKPSNVLITPSGQAKLVDMGLARLHQVEHTENDLTASGVTLGTFDYISPEQAKDPRTADIRSDLYSLGCTLYFMLTGRPPFPDGTVLQKLLRHQGDEPPDPRDFREEVSDSLAELTNKLLAKAPDARFQSADDLISSLGDICEELDLPVSDSMRPVSQSTESIKLRPVAAPRRKYAKHLPWVVPLMLLLVATIVIDHLTTSNSVEVSFEDPRAASVTPADLDKLPVPDRNEGETFPSSGILPENEAVAETVSPANNSAPPAKTESAPAVESPSGNTPTSPAEETSPKQAGTDPKVTPGSASDSTSTAQTNPASSGPRAEENSPVDAGEQVARIEPSEKTTATKTPAAGTSPADPKQSPAATSGTDDPVGPMAPLIVDPAGAVGAYSSLEAACAAATSGDVIELRFDGVLPTTPFKLTNLTLTIRAGRDHHPKLLFQPGPSDNSPELYPRSMITATGGDLTLVGLNLYLNLSPEVPAENWTLLELRGMQSLVMEECALTINNAAEGGGSYHQDVQMIDIKPAPGEAMIRDMPTTSFGAIKLKPVSIRLLNCVARGESVLLRTAQMEPVDFTWLNGLAALSEPMFRMNASQSNMRDSCRLQADLQHVTAVLRRGLLLCTNSDDAPYPVEADFNCKDSIFMVGSDAALVEQRCVHPASSLQEMIIWTGERNFFEGFTTFWNVRVMGLGDQDQIAPMDFEAWRSYWQQRPEGYAIQSQLGAVIWKHLPAANLPLHLHTPENYLLGEGVAGNPARGAAKNGGDVGFEADLLPAFADSSDTATP